MKTLLTPLFVLLAFQAMTLAGIGEDIPKGNQVILSSGAWKPSPEDAQRALTAIQSFLEHPSSTNDWIKIQIKKIQGHSKEYRVQFVGELRDGKKVVWCNFFPGPRDGEKDSFKQWKQQVIMVDDGGFWFWQIDYDPSTRTCTRFIPNFEA